MLVRKFSKKVLCAALVFSSLGFTPTLSFAAETTALDTNSINPASANVPPLRK